MTFDILHDNVIVAHRGSVAFFNQNLLTKQHISQPEGKKTHRVFFQKYWLEVHDLDSVELKVEPEWVSLRTLIGTLSSEQLYPLFKAAHISYWLSKNRYCSCCGHALRHEFEPVLKAVCTECAHQAYPKIQPCIIVAVNRGDQILLAKNAANKRDFYSLIAGFVEPGESLEQAVAREVLEETGLSIKQIEYLGSQPWPFPMNLMIGFKAEYASGDIELVDQELSDAQFFSSDQLPTLAPEGSIARRIIDQQLFGRSLEL